MNYGDKEEREWTYRYKRKRMGHRDKGEREWAIAIKKKENVP
jgi:hypothetical protein